MVELTITLKLRDGCIETYHADRCHIYEGFLIIETMAGKEQDASVLITDMITVDKIDSVNVQPFVTVGGQRICQKASG